LRVAIRGKLEIRVDDTGFTEGRVRPTTGRKPTQGEEDAIPARCRSVSGKTFIAGKQDTAVTLDRDSGRQRQDAAAWQARDACAAERRIQEPSRRQPENVEVASVEIGPGHIHAPGAVHRDRPEEALPPETDFLFAAAAEQRVWSPRLRQAQNPKNILAQTVESCYDNDATDAIDGKLGTE
jgi:hypothetical protein